MKGEPDLLLVFLGEGEGKTETSSPRETPTVPGPSSAWRAWTFNYLISDEGEPASCVCSALTVSLRRLVAASPRSTAALTSPSGASPHWALPAVQLLGSLGHTGRRRAGLGHTVNTQTLRTTDEKTKVLSKLTILCYATVAAVLGAPQAE